MQSLFAADKMNVAALGNVVPQLHVHVVARHAGDPAWPRPVWGAVPRRPYAEAERDAMVGRLRKSITTNRPAATGLPIHNMGSQRS
jgi:diadenosine tetraphosphate (Ap4A) HIT family hydrolase